MDDELDDKQKIAIIEQKGAEMNRKSMKKNGHPAFVSVRIDGELRYIGYKDLTEKERAEMIKQGIIAD